MSEWITFTFSSTDDFRSFLKITLDGEVQTFDTDDLPATSPGIMYIGGDRTEVSLECEVHDVHASGTGNHIVQIDIDDVQGAAKPSVSLDSITLCDQVHTSESGSINEEVTTWTLIDAEYQAMIDAGTVISDSVETADLGYGSQNFSKSNWTGNTIIGKGSWQLAFSCPYTDWFDTVHND